MKPQFIYKAIYRGRFENSIYNAPVGFGAHLGPYRQRSDTCGCSKVGSKNMKKWRTWRKRRQLLVFGAKWTNNHQEAFGKNLNQFFLRRGFFLENFTPPKKTIKIVWVGNRKWPPVSNSLSILKPFPHQFFNSLGPFLTRGSHHVVTVRLLEVKRHYKKGLTSSCHSKKGI